MSAFVKAQICTQMSLHADSVTMVQHPWQRLFQDPSMSWENRTNKDISTVDSKLDCLQANHKSLHANTAVGRPCYDTGMLSSTDQPSTERLWQGYCKYPTLHSDGESNEHEIDLSDFLYKTSKEAHWKDNWETLDWVKEVLEKKTPRAIAWSSFQRGSHFYSAGRAGNAIHNRLPQLTKVKEIHAHMMESGSEFQLFETNSLIDLYVKCESMVDAHHVFDNMPKRNVVSWNTIILGYAKQNNGALALDLYSQMQQECVQPSDQTFVGALRACSSLAAPKGKHGKFFIVGCLEKGRAIHSQVMNSGFDSDLYVGNTLVNMYAKCRSMDDAQHVFDVLPHRDVVSWNALISGYVKQDECALALEMYAQMHQEGFQPSIRTFVVALKACSRFAPLDEGKQVVKKIVKTGCLEKGRVIHSELVERGFESDVFVGNTLMDMYVKCGSMEDAQHVFDKLPFRDVVSWNAMILGYAKNNEGMLALDLHTQMHQEGVQPNDRSFVGLLKACSNLAVLEERKQVDGEFRKTLSLDKGRSIHYQVMMRGFESGVFVGATLVDMYAKCRSMEDARNVFDKLPHQNVVSWTSMILGYVKQEEGVLALELYAKMHQEGVMPDPQTFVGTVKACSSLAALEEGKQVDNKFVKPRCLEKGRAIHSEIVKSGLELDVFVGTTLVDMYAKCGKMGDAQHVFYVLPHRDVVAWTAMILGYAKQEEGELALELYAWMHKEGVQPSDRTFVSALNACSSLAALEEGLHVQGIFVKVISLGKGRAIHAQVVKCGFESDVIVGNSLMDMYLKCWSMVDARLVFDELPCRSVVSWNAIIRGYAELEENEEAIKLYLQMQVQGLKADSLTFASILKACGNTAALEFGKELHAHICKTGLDSTATVATTLIKMYAKCSSMVDAQRLFDAIPRRDVVAWSVLIAGYARQGKSDLVFHLFERMRQEGIEPNGFTFLSVLTACSHVGLVEKGWRYFQVMIQQYGISPSTEHYNCMVDLFGRAGQVERAVTVVENIPNAVLWLTMLGVCKKWQNVELGRYVFEHTVRLDAKHAAAYILMSNIYVDSQMQNDCNKVGVLRMLKYGKTWNRVGLALVN